MTTGDIALLIIVCVATLGLLCLLLRLWEWWETGQ
jgi:hypothetical protein